MGACPTQMEDSTLADEIRGGSPTASEYTIFYNVSWYQVNYDVTSHHYRLPVHITLHITVHQSISTLEAIANYGLPYTRRSTSTTYSTSLTEKPSKASTALRLNTPIMVLKKAIGSSSPIGYSKLTQSGNA
ncbi:hypothetical protein BBAD15_g12148 [Beauveria bassiana D1-5]|uniref:Uncharacterized protein n=1 Tax=Beauveria bassiana D1-5 TaxID=1245745 RepID=A0A0A2V598_BEABA|nr:hypothetical protein BBAD15_g12148 [Beauveria bassiana D1-5]